jgi:hypothetical protein
MIRFYSVTLALLLTLVQNSEVKAVTPALDAVKNVEYFGSLPTTAEYHLDDLKNNAKKWKDQAAMDFNPVDRHDTETYKQKDNASNRYGVYRFTFGNIRFWVASRFNAEYNHIRVGLPQNRLAINVDREQGDVDAFYIFNHNGRYLTRREGSSYAPGNANLAFQIEENNLKIYGHDDSSRRSQLDRITGEYLSKIPENLLESIPLDML